MRMNKDGLFKIMQITDMQEIPKVSPDTMALLDAAIEDEKPDLVVYTGDQIKGYGVSYKGKGKELENAVAKTIVVILKEDFSKALGQCLRRRLPPKYPFICLDGIECKSDDYIDIGEPIAGNKAVPVVVKTLVFGGKKK